MTTVAHSPRRPMTAILTTALIALFSALILHIGLVAAFFTENPLAWSWLAQISALALGISIGLVLGLRARTRS